MLLGAQRECIQGAVVAVTSPFWFLEILGEELCREQRLPVHLVCRGKSLWFGGEPGPSCPPATQRKMQDPSPDQVCHRQQHARLPVTYFKSVSNLISVKICFNTWWKLLKIFSLAHQPLNSCPPAPSLFRAVTSNEKLVLWAFTLQSFTCEQIFCMPRGKADLFKNINSLILYYAYTSRTLANIQARPPLNAL